MIRLMVPDMPTADELLPYLRRIDAAKIYTNGGPLVRELEACLTDLLKAPAIAVSNGTVALELALRALRLPRGSHVLVPAMTFVATGHAVWNAQLKPVLCDVDPATWQLTPASAIDAAQGWPIRAVVPVAAFGLPVPIAPWEQFARDTHIPVVIDAAGALMDQCVSQSSSLITTFSLHATKFLGAGEGGAVSTVDRMLLQRVTAMAAFGHSGTNAKMSEYHAAIALASASIDRMTVKLERAGRIAHAYKTALGELPGITLQRNPRPDNTMLVAMLPPACAASDAQHLLANHDIDSKQWYRPFLDELAQFSGCPRPFSMPTTQALRTRMLGLPFHTSMTEANVAEVCSVLSRTLTTHT